MFWELGVFLPGMTGPGRVARVSRWPHAGNGSAAGAGGPAAGVVGPTGWLARDRFGQRPARARGWCGLAPGWPSGRSGPADGVGQRTDGGRGRGWADGWSGGWGEIAAGGQGQPG